MSARDPHYLARTAVIKVTHTSYSAYVRTLVLAAADTERARVIKPAPFFEGNFVL